jgi:site-specific DNA-methyltransferase (adenine-specific)
VRAWITWYETFGINQANNFNRCSRRLLYCTKGEGLVFNHDAFTRPSDRQVKYGDRRADPGGKLWDDVWGVNPKIPRVVGTAAERIPDFPTQLPLDLLRPIVLGCSDPGDSVLDPFNGSGTTGVAAVIAGRRYVGIEKSARFAAMAEMRLKACGITELSEAGKNGDIVTKTRSAKGRKAPAAVRGAIGTLFGLATGLDSFTVKDAAPTADEAAQWEKDLGLVVSAIRRLRGQLKEINHG